MKKIPSVTLRDTCFKSILIGHSKKSTDQKCSKQALHKFTREIFFIGLSTNSASYFSSSSNLLSSFFSNNRLFIFRFFSKLERKTNWPTARLIGLTFSASTFLSFGCRFFAKNENLFSTISREYYFYFSRAPSLFDFHFRLSEYFLRTCHARVLACSLAPPVISGKVGLNLRP